MSGHSKWSQIKRQKGVADVKRGNLFTKMTREIMIAAKQGGGDPEANFRLRLAMDRARSVNMPKDSIQRAIERATDNRNRTASEVRAAFTRHGGKLGEAGSVQWLFEQKGVIEVDAPGKTDEVELAAIDAGAEDVETDKSLVTVYTAPRDFEKVKKALEAAGIHTASAEMSMRPTSTVHVDGDIAQKVIRLVEALEELDDVQAVHANFDIPEEVLATV